MPDSVGTSPVTGPEALTLLLQRVDPAARIRQIRQDLPAAKGERLSKLHRELKYLTALQATGQRPEQAYTLGKVPVLPPIYRPLYPDERGRLVVSSVNELLRDLGSVNAQLQDAADLPGKDRRALQRDLYDATAAVFGLADPLSWKKDAQGIFQQIAGKHSPKGGFFQDKVIRRRQNLSGRSTITVEPSLGLDEVGIPEEMAWTTFQPFVVKQLVSAGHGVADARDEVQQRTSLARRALEAEMAERPVLLNRAPSLHKFSVMGFRPKLVAGRDIKLNPLVLAGFNADFDGDSMAVHVPLSHKARDEAAGMLPSKHLFKPGDERLMAMPGQAAVLGLYLMSKGSGATKKPYADTAAAMTDLEAGTLREEDPIELAGVRTTLGRKMIEQVLPSGTAFGTLDKPELERVLSDVARRQPADFSRVVEGLRHLGDEYATRRGFSIGLDDLEPVERERNLLIAQADRRLKDRRPVTQDRTKDLETLYGRIGDNLEQLLKDRRASNPMVQMVAAKSRGSAGQVRQVLGAPLLVTDAKDRVVPIPIRRSYAEGLDPQEYWAAAYGVRKGMVGRSQQTALPGALAKELLASVADAVVTTGSPPDGAEHVELSLEKPDDVVDRFLADTVRDRAGKVLARRNDLVTPERIARWRAAGVPRVKLHSPLNAELPGGGLSALSFGLNERGQMPEVGDNLGLLAGQAITEPLSQMTLKSFHSGGLAGAGSNVPEGFERIRQLLELPETVRGKATLSTTDGTIEAVTATPAGGHRVTVGGVDHHVPAGRRIAVKEGDRITKGRPLSDGVVKPQELLELSGLRAAQDYLVDELQRNLPGIRRRYVEAVVGSMTSMAHVDDPGDRDDLLPGDIVPAWRTRPTGGAGSAGSAGSAGERSPTTTPILRGVNVLPLIKAQDNWLAGMDYRRLREVLQEGVLRGAEAPIHAFHPIPAYAYGAQFGLGGRGQY